MAGKNQQLAVRKAEIEIPGDLEQALMEEIERAEKGVAAARAELQARLDYVGRLREGVIKLSGY